MHTGVLGLSSWRVRLSPGGAVAPVLARCTLAPVARVARLPEQLLATEIVHREARSLLETAAGGGRAAGELAGVKAQARWERVDEFVALHVAISTRTTRGAFNRGRVTLTNKRFLLLAGDAWGSASAHNLSTQPVKVACGEQLASAASRHLRYVEMS